MKTGFLRQLPFCKLLLETSLQELGIRPRKQFGDKSKNDTKYSQKTQYWQTKITSLLNSNFSIRFLSVKKWLLRKKHQIELARKRGWKGYWVCLKGTTLLFYPCDSREGRSVEAAPKHLIIVDGAIMQPIPEHPKRDHIFCLSTAFGDAYLFQAPCQVRILLFII